MATVRRRKPARRSAISRPSGSSAPVAATIRSSRLSLVPRRSSRRGEASRRSSARVASRATMSSDAVGPRLSGERGRSRADRRAAAGRPGERRRGPVGRRRRGPARGRAGRRSDRPRSARTRSPARSPRSTSRPLTPLSPGAAGIGTRNAAAPGRARYRLTAAAASGSSVGTWTASGPRADPRRRPPVRRTTPIAAARTSRPRPSRASRASWPSSSAARWSSSARRLTRKPITLRSSWIGSTRAIRNVTTARPDRRRPRARRRRRRRPRPRRAAAPAPGPGRTPRRGRRPPRRPGATTASDELGTIARSPGSSASNAGTRAFITRTQRDLARGARRGRAAGSARAVGKIASRTSRRLAISRSGWPCPLPAARRGPRRGRRAAVRTRGRSRRIAPTGRRSPVAHRGDNRAQTRRRGR